MKSFAATVNRLLTSALSGAALLTFIGACSARAQVMSRFPGESPGPPAYANVERPFIWHTEQWAAIVFLRAPDCVPPNFNLLDFYDIPAAFGCLPLTVSGFELLDANGALKQVVSSGIAVPVWFVPWPVLKAAMADNVLTKPELESLNPLKGVATIFHQVLHPTHLTITASGALSDGRSFQYEFNSVEYGTAQHVKIEIR